MAEWWGGASWLSGENALRLLGMGVGAGAGWAAGGGLAGNPLSAVTGTWGKEFGAWAADEAIRGIHDLAQDAAQWWVGPSAANFYQAPYPNIVIRPSIEELGISSPFLHNLNNISVSYPHSYDVSLLRSDLYDSPQYFRPESVLSSTIGLSLPTTSYSPKFQSDLHDSPGFFRPMSTLFSTASLTFPTSSYMPNFQSDLYSAPGYFQLQGGFYDAGSMSTSPGFSLGGGM